MEMLKVSSLISKLKSPGVNGAGSRKQREVLLDLYCEMVSLSVRLMKMSANEMKLCQMELFLPPIQLGKVLISIFILSAAEKKDLDVAISALH